MKVVVKFHTVLRTKIRNLNQGQAEYQIPEGSTIESLLEVLEIDMDPEDLLLGVNGRTAFRDHVLEEGDRVDLIPAISGG